MAEVIAYGPPIQEKPFSPEFLVVKDGPILLRAVPGKIPDTEVALTPLLARDEAVRLGEPVPWRPGWWPVMEESGLKWISGPDLDGWKRQRSQEVFGEAGKTQDPERKIGLLKASARLAGVQVDALLERLESVRSSPEDRLEQLFQKLKDDK